MEALLATEVRMLEKHEMAIGEEGARESVVDTEQTTSNLKNILDQLHRTDGGGKFIAAIYH